MASSTIKQQSIPIRYESANFSGANTVGSSNYVELGTVASGHTILSVVVSSWASNTGAFSIACGAGNKLYLIGNANTVVRDLNLRIAYI